MDSLRFTRLEDQDGCPAVSVDAGLGSQYAFTCIYKEDGWQSRATEKGAVMPDVVVEVLDDLRDLPPGKYSVILLPSH